MNFPVTTVGQARWAQSASGPLYMRYPLLEADFLTCCLIEVPSLSSLSITSPFSFFPGEYHSFTESCTGAFCGLSISYHTRGSKEQRFLCAAMVLQS